LRSVKEREQIAVATQKKIVLANLLHGAQLASERAIELLPAASCKDALIGVGILVDKLQLLSGDVTARFEVEHARPKLSNLEQFEQIIQGLEKEVEGRVIELGEGAPEMGSAARNDFSKQQANGASEISATDLPALGKAQVHSRSPEESAGPSEPFQESAKSLPAGADPQNANVANPGREQDRMPEPAEENLFGFQEGRVA
jgi:hypothetical protein